MLMSAKTCFVNDQNVMECIDKGDETRTYAYDPERTDSSWEYLATGATKPKRSCQIHSKIVQKEIKPESLRRNVTKNI